jgi:hypothetical protein
MCGHQSLGFQPWLGHLQSGHMVMLPAAWSHGLAGTTMLELQVDHVVKIIFVPFYSYPLHYSVCFKFTE